MELLNRLDKWCNTLDFKLNLLFINFLNLSRTFIEDHFLRGDLIEC